MRKIAILNTTNADFNANIIGKLNKDDEITVFVPDNHKMNCIEGVKTVEYPNEMLNCIPKLRNFVIKSYIDEGFKGFLHVLEDTTLILKDPKDFMDEIEVMMDVLDQKSWFNTETDPCNYTFYKYNPRFRFTVDKDDVKSVYDKRLTFTSHANTQWTCFNLRIADLGDICLDESFTIAMFYIIKFLANRRNNKKNGEIYYMNFYPTVDQEHGVFKAIKAESYIKQPSEEQQNRTMVEQNAIFQQMKINNGADMSIEQIMDDVYNLLLSKKEKNNLT